MQTSQPLFPSSICAAALDITDLLEDVQVNSDGIAGYCYIFSTVSEAFSVDATLSAESCDTIKHLVSLK